MSERRSARRHQRGMRLGALLIAAFIVPTLIAPGASPVHADPAASLEVSKSSPGSVLANEDIGYTLTATNAGDAPGYNLTFRDVLPAGVSYVPGSTAPAQAGEPDVIVDDISGVTTLIWRNVADLQANDSFTISFTAAPDPAHYPVGATVANEGSAYINEDPRWIPTFEADGSPVPPDEQNGTVRAADDGTETDIASLEITKTEPSPEGELLRGVHTQATTYTLRVRTTDQGGHTGTVIEDRLPAGLEYLGCGSTDNTTTGEEYPGSGPLDPTGPLDPCLLPATVETIDDDGTVFTVLTWDLGSLDAGDEVVIEYRAGIPLRENTLDFQGPTPGPDSFDQGANLDNNTGASTREGSLDAPGERSLTNTAQVDAVYQGPVIDGLAQPLPVSDTDTETVTIEDVRMQKSVAVDGFVAGEVATFTINIDVSEYVNASDIVVTDVLPNGMCPLVPDENPLGEPLCDFAGSGAVAPTHPVASVTHDASTGEFTVVFEAIDDISADGSFAITYEARMLPAYTGGGLTDVPVVVGDSFTNTVSLLAETTPIPDTGETGTWIVDDASSASLGTGDLGIAKRILPRYATDPDSPTLLPDAPGAGAAGTCPTGPSQYAGQIDLDEAQVAFRLGDVVCFLLQVNFSDNLDTRNPVVTDLLPSGVTYVEGSAVAATGNTAAFEIEETPSPTTGPTFLLGDVDGDDRFVGPGEVFLVVLAGQIVDIPDGDDPDVRGNLMKMRTENTAGQVRSYRDQLEFLAVPGVRVDLLKGVASVDTPAAGPNTPDIDGEMVQRESAVTYRIDVANTGVAENYTDVSARGIEVWDLLPELVTCANVDASSISNFVDPTTLLPTAPTTPQYGACLDPTDGAYPSSLGGDRSVIRWAFPSPDLDDDHVIEPGSTRTLTYTVTMPSDLSAGLNGPNRIENTAGVRQVEGFSNIDGETATFVPADNIDPDLAGQSNIPSADDISWVVTPDTEVTKTGVTSITETNNNEPSQAVIGERVTYTYAVEIPPQTAVHGGVLSDALPTNFELVSVDDGFFYTDASDSGTVGALPAGFDLDANGSLTFPTTYVNETDLTQRFEVVVTARVVAGSLNQTTQPNRTNTARFSSDVEPGGDPLPEQTDTHTIQVRQPTPTLSKSNDVTDVATGGDTVTYTLVAATSGSRPPLHRGVVIDCLPEPLVFQAGSVDPAASFVDDTAGDGTNGCPTGTTRLEFDLGTIEPGSANQATITYQALVPVDVVGGDEFENTATLTGNSLRADDPNPGDGREYSATADSTFEVRSSELTKTVDPGSATIGEEVTYTLEVRVPGQQSLYQFTVVDTVPAGLTDITFVGSSCVLDDGADTACTLPLTFLGPVAAGGASTIGFTAGDLTDVVVDDRLVTITYTAVVADESGNVPGANLMNTADTRWNADDTGDEVTVGNFDGYEWDRTGPEGSATLGVVEPSLGIAKSVSDATPEPGETFTYTVTVSNASGPNVSDTYDIEIADVVPVGVVVDEATISGGGSYDAPSRTVTWQIAGPLAPGASMPFTYSATLADSDTLSTGDELTNTATVDEYFSLPAGNDERREYAGPSDDATVTPAFPALDTTKTVLDGPPVYIGDEVTWRIVTENTGDGSAFDLVIGDVLPPNWTYVAGSTVVVVPGDPDPLDPAPVPVLGADPAGRVTLTWSDFLVELEPDQQVTIEFQAVPGPDVVDDPGIGSIVPHTNDTTSTADDRSVAPGNADGPYTDDDDASTRIDAVDLLLVKDGPDTVDAGTNITWTITVSNQSTTDTAVGPFTVTDTLPEGVTFVSAGGDGWSCDHDAGTITCDRSDGNDTLDPEGSFPVISIVVAVAADVDAGTTYENTAVVTGLTYELNPDDNTDIDTVTVTTAADLAVTKDGPPTVIAGESITWTVVVTNNGPSDSVATVDDPITIVDELPPGTSYDSATGTDWTCDFDTGDGEITCTYPLTLTPGQSAPQVTIIADVDSDVSVGAELLNTVTVTPGETPDPNPGNNTDDHPTDVETSADLAIVKDRTSPDPLIAGEPVEWTLTVDNSGPSDAAAPVTVVDTLPDGFTYASHTGPWDCAVSGQVVTCTLVADPSAEPVEPVGLAAGETAPALVLTADTDPSLEPDEPGEPFQYVNTATVSSPTPDPNPDNNTDTEGSGVEGEADLAITKTGPDAADAGSQITWTLSVTNNGPSDSVASADDPITVVDTLPSEVTFVATTGDGWDCSHVEGIVTCDRITTLAAGASAPDITINVDIDPSAGPGSITNAATVSPGETNDPVPANNTDTDPVTITEDVELTIAKTTTGANPVLAGETTEFSIVVTNEGPSSARQVTVVDTLPDGLTAIGASGDGWLCTPSPTPATPASIVSCTLPELVPGASTPLVITAEVASNAPDETTLTNTATVSTVTPGDDPDNNTDTSTVDVVAEADLAITKTHADGTVLAGDDVVFTIEVANSGPSDAVAPITVIDDLPPGFRFVTNGGPWSCEAVGDVATGEQVTCTLVDPTADPTAQVGLAAGSTAADLTITAATDPALEATDLDADDPVGYVNVVAVSSPTTDPNPDNDTDDDPVTIDRLTNISIVKTHTGPVRIGDPFTFTLQVRNDGPSEARDVQVADTVPGALELDSVTAAGWTCETVAQTVTCDLDTALAPATDAPPITLTVTPTPAAYPSVTNTATVSTSTPETDLTDNTDSETVSVPPLVNLSITKTSTDDFVVGQQGTYSLVVTNAGPTPDPGPITVVDVIPAGLTPVSVTPTSDCTITGQRVECTLPGVLTVGSTLTVDITVEIGPAAAPSVTNTATVSTPSEETTLDDNTDSDTRPVEPVWVLDVDKRLVSVDGDLATWEIVVTNIGPSPTGAPIVAVDDLPGGLSFVSAAGSGWSCAEAAGVVTCEYPAALPVDGTATFRIVTSVTAPPGTVITNVVTVGDEGDVSPPAADDAPLTVPSPPPGPSPDPAPSPDPGPEIPATGGEPAPILRLAFMLMLLGSALTLLRRSRRPTAEATPR